MKLLPTYDSSRRTLIWFKYINAALYIKNPRKGNTIASCYNPLNIDKNHMFDKWLNDGYSLTRRTRE